MSLSDVIAGGAIATGSNIALAVVAGVVQRRRAIDAARSTLSQAALAATAASGGAWHAERAVESAERAAASTEAEEARQALRVAKSFVAQEKQMTQSAERAVERAGDAHEVLLMRGGSRMIAQSNRLYRSIAMMVALGARPDTEREELAVAEREVLDARAELLIGNRFWRRSRIEGQHAHTQ